MVQGGSARDRPDGTPSVDRGEVNLWYAVPGSIHDTHLLTAYEALLLPDEERRYRGYRLERGRREYLITRALVRCVLSEYRPVPPEEWRFRSNAYGRPEIDPPRGLRFNLSNCEGLVICAVADRLAVGVDAEPYSRANTIVSLAPRIFSHAELDGMSRLATARAREQRALSLWTLKESYAKARGLGLSLPLQSLCFALDGEGITLAADPPDDARDRWDFTLLDVGSCRVALTVERGAQGSSTLGVWETIPLTGLKRRVI